VIDEGEDRKHTRWRLGWPAVSAIVGVMGIAALGTGYVAGRDAAVERAAIDRKVLYENAETIEALRKQMAGRMEIDAVQNIRLDLMEKQHSELMARLNSLLDIMWKDEIRREGRR